MDLHPITETDQLVSDFGQTMALRRCQTVRGKVYRLNTTAEKSESLVQFIERLVTRYIGSRLWLYLKNPRVYRSKALKKWLADHPKVAPNYLPDTHYASIRRCNGGTVGDASSSTTFTPHQTESLAVQSDVLSGTLHLPL